MSKEELITKLLDGHIVQNRTNSGGDWGMTKNKKFSQPKGVSKKWIKDNLNDNDIIDLIEGETVGLTRKRGRGYSYQEYFRTPILAEITKFN